MLQLLKKLLGQTDNESLKKAIQNGAFLVDVRTPEEFSGGSIKGAVNIPLQTLSIELSKFRNKKGIVFFCRTGVRSNQAKGILEQIGLQNIFNGGSLQNVKKLINN